MGHKLPTPGAPSQGDMQILTEWKHGVICKSDWSSDATGKKKKKLSWPAQLDPEIQSGQPESSRLQDEREEEGREDLEEVRGEQLGKNPTLLLHK